MRGGVLGFLFGLGVGVFLVASGLPERGPRERLPPAMPSPTAAGAQRPLPQAEPAVVQELFLLVRGATDGSWSELQLVEDGRVHAVPLPAGVDQTTVPVTDGHRLYAYIGRRGSVGGPTGPGYRLAAFSLDGREEETLSDTTALVEPRGLFVSPNGSAVAFFLDNRQTLETELWAYDTAAREKRVSAEHLTREGLSGPFFSPDGSFLLRSNTRLLGGSVRRTGVDIFSLRPPDARWEAGAAASPQGERVAVVIGGEEGSSAIITYGLRGRLTASRVLTAAGQARILGWWAHRLSAPGSPGRLLVRTDGGDGITVLALEGTRAAPYPLPGAADVAPADGEAVGVLWNSGNVLRLGALEIPSGATRVVRTLEPATPSATPGALGGLAEPFAPRDIPGVRLVQYLRPPRESSGSSARWLPTPEETQTILQAAQSRIREIADAGPTKTATAERVWFTAVPGTVYVDYRVGTTLWRRLIRIEELSSSQPTVAIVGVFAPVRGEWVLARGQDGTDRTITILYEFDHALATWQQKPLAEGAVPE